MLAVASIQLLNNSKTTPGIQNRSKPCGLTHLEPHKRRTKKESSQRKCGTRGRGSHRKPWAAPALRRPPSSGLTYREARELCNELMTRVQVSTRTYRWRRYDDVFRRSGQRLAILPAGPAHEARRERGPGRVAAPDADGLRVYWSSLQENDELTGLNEKHANVIKVTNHTYHGFASRNCRRGSCGSRFWKLGVLRVLPNPDQ